MIMANNEKSAKIRQAIYRGAKSETIVRELKASVAQINRERTGMQKLGITAKTISLTTPQAAYLLGLSPTAKRIGVYIRDGRLPSRKQGRDIVIDKDDFLEFARYPRLAGRPDLLLKKAQKSGA